jgi:hypothetical protein
MSAMTQPAGRSIAAPASNGEFPKPSVFRPARRSAGAVSIVAFATAVTYSFFAIGLLTQRSVVLRLNDGEAVTLQQALNADRLAQSGLVAVVVTSLALLVTLIVWLWRASSNTEAFGVGPQRLGRAWLIGAWLVPVANLILPKRLLDDVWRASDADASANPEWTRLPGSRLVALWWVTFVASVVITGLAIGLGNGNDLAAVAQSKLIHAAGAGLAAAAAILIAVAVQAINRRQDRRAVDLRLTDLHLRSTGI